MILIFSENNDFSTNKVIEWLIYYKKKYIRLNPSNKIKLVNLSHDGFCFSHENKLICVLGPDKPNQR